MQPGKWNTVLKLWAVCAGRSARLSPRWLRPFLKCLLERREAVWGPAATLGSRVIGLPPTRHVGYPAVALQFVFSDWWKSLFCFTEMDVLNLLWGDLCCCRVQTRPMFYFSEEVKIYVYMNFNFTFQNQSVLVYGVVFVVPCFYVVDGHVLTDHMLWTGVHKVRIWELRYIFPRHVSFHLTVEDSISIPLVPHWSAAVTELLQVSVK